jgi:hypothetical protein
MIYLGFKSLKYDEVCTTMCLFTLVRRRILTKTFVQQTKYERDAFTEIVESGMINDREKDGSSNVVIDTMANSDAANARGGYGDGNNLQDIVIDNPSDYGISEPAYTGQPTKSMG